MRKVSWTTDLETVRGLFQDYRQWLADHRDPSASADARVKEGLAEVDALVAGLPGAYGPPQGEILLWFEGGKLAACGALRALRPGIGEIKRIYIRPDHRGGEFGKLYVQALVDQARDLGFERLRADTLPSMAAAIEFYQKAGFKPIAAYWPNPVAGARFFEYRAKK